MSAWSVQRLDDLPRRSIFTGVEFRAVGGENAAFAEAWFAKGAAPVGEGSHHHEAEELIYVVEGELALVLGEQREPVSVRSGEVIVIPSNVSHGGHAVEDTHIIAVYSPVRSDLVSG